jgi:hypothetical protein
MPVASLVFLTPAAAIAGVVVLVPLAALALAARRERRGRETLGLPAPPAARRAPHAIALAAVPALLAVAAAEPALQTTAHLRTRTDAQAMFIVDNSRSMLAAAHPGASTRLARAKTAADALRFQLTDIPTGLGTLTDRVLPSLLPDPDPNIFARTVRDALTIEEPPPTISDVEATSLAALGDVATQNYFAPQARKRLLVVFTDGESRPFDPRAVARELGTGPGVKLVLVDMSRPGEAVYDNGKREAGYREDPASRQTLNSLAAATGGKVVTDGSLGSAASFARRYLGTGPTVAAGTTTHTRTLAPFVALLALIPLIAVLWPGLRRALPVLASFASAPRNTQGRSAAAPRRVPVSPRSSVQPPRTARSS